MPKESSSSSAWIVFALVAAVAGSQLLEPIQAAAHVVVAMDPMQKFCVLAFIVAIIMGVVSVASPGAATASPSAPPVTPAPPTTTQRSAPSVPLVTMRGLTVEHNQSNRKPPKNYPLSEMAACKKDGEKFKCLYPMLRGELLGHMRQNNEMDEEAVNWVGDMMDYNVPGGKLNRGTTVISVYRALHPGRDLSETEIARASVLGWAIEFLQAFFLVADDLMDGSQTRRGQPCWYQIPKVKLIAINDAFILESFVYAILREHFHDDEFYPELLELMIDVTQKTEFGQLLDLTSQSGPKVDLKRFTLRRYKSIVKYKTAFYTFYLPVAFGMLLSGKYKQDTAAFDTARRILMIMGEYFQVQDDYLDCYGDPAVIGKVGTDIQDNKCSWLVVQALERCNASQRKILEQNYGEWNDKKVAKVKALYKELNLQQAFEEYEEQSYKWIQSLWDQITIPRDVFEMLLMKIYKRSK